MLWDMVGSGIFIEVLSHFVFKQINHINLLINLKIYCKKTAWYKFQQCTKVNNRYNNIGEENFQCLIVE